MQIQVLDINYKSDYNRNPIINIFGSDINGNPCIIDVVNFKPFFYVLPMEGRFDDVFLFIMEINENLRLEEVERFKPIGYQSKPVRMIKVIPVSPKDVKPLREKIGQEIPYVLDIFEADILFHSRFSADTGIMGMSWIDVPKNVVKYDEIRVIEKQEDAPFKILSVDIECLAPDDGSFPKSEKDPIILVSLSFSSLYKGVKDLVIIAKKVECNRPDIIAVDSERELLKIFHDIVLDFNPDLLTGYNINEFDIPYIDGRMNKVGIACNFGRDGSGWFIKVIGVKKEIMIAGRVVVDTLPMVRRNYSLAQYTLKNVSKELLKLEKLDVPPNKMREYWFSEDERFREFIKYSRRDAVLGMMLLMDLGMLQKYIALSKTSGILLQTVISGGQSVMLEFMLLQRFNRLNRVMAMKPQQEEGEDYDEIEFQGAYVSKPEVGLHEHLILTDFQSLYPSIIISNNLCPTTVIINESVEEGNFHVDPNGGKFVNPDVLPGILPKMLDEVLKKRIEVKKKMKMSNDQHEKDVLDAIQYALKIVINSAYGWCGYKRSRLFNLTVASAVTAYGRDIIMAASEKIESIKLENNNKKFSFHVVYNDTDSAYIEVLSDDEVTIDDANAVGQKVADIVSEPMIYPMKLNYEGYARRAIFLAKKRYGMWLMEKGKDGVIKDKIKVKGMEVVRRDWCKLTANTMKSCLDLILKEGKIIEASEVVMYAICRVNTFQFSDKELLEDLALTRNYHKSPEQYKNVPPHMKLIEKMKKRGEQLPGMGDRISYYIVRGPEKFRDRAESLDFIIKSKLSIDTEYYVNKQLVPPFRRIFDALDVDMKTGKKKRHEGDVFNYKPTEQKINIPEVKKQKTKKKRDIFSFG
jgi:DNA polymerase, archaea type